MKDLLFACGAILSTVAVLVMIAEPVYGLASFCIGLTMLAFSACYD